MYIDYDLFHLTVLLTIHVDVGFSVCICVGIWGCPNSINVRRVVFPILSILNSPPNSDSDTDAATCLSTAHKICIVPLSLIGYVLLCLRTNKYRPPYIDSFFLWLVMTQSNVFLISYYIFNIL